MDPERIALGAHHQADRRLRAAALIDRRIHRVCGREVEADIANVLDHADHLDPRRGFGAALEAFADGLAPGPEAIGQRSADQRDERLAGAVLRGEVAPLQDRRLHRVEIPRRDASKLHRVWLAVRLWLMFDLDDREEWRADEEHVERGAGGDHARASSANAFEHLLDEARAVGFVGIRARIEANLRGHDARARRSPGSTSEAAAASGQSAHSTTAARAPWRFAR